MANSNSNIKLLIPFNGANNATSARDYSNSAHTLTFNGNAKISTAQSYHNGGSSIFFDGTNSSVTIGGLRTDTDFGTDYFTIKFRINFSSITGERFIFSKGASDGSTYLEMEYYSGSISITRSGSLGTSAGTFTPVVGRWYDVAFVRKGTIGLWYVDEVQIPSTTSTAWGDLGTLDYDPYIGRCEYDPSPRWFQGYIQDFTIVKSEAWNTHKFYDSTLDAKIPDHVWKFGDYNVYDCVGTEHLTNSGATFTSVGLQGYKTVTLNGSSQYLSVAPNADQQFGTGEFAVGGWFNWASSPSVAYLFGMGAGASADIGGWNFYSEGSSRIDFYLHNDSGGMVMQFDITGLSLGTNTWHFLAATRDAAGRVDVWLDDESIGHQTFTGTFNYGASNTLYFGRTYDNGRYFPGQMQDLFTMKGKSYNQTEITKLYNLGRAKLLELDARRHAWKYADNYLDSYKTYAVAGYPLNEMAGVRYDDTGHSHLTDNGTVPYVTDPTYGRVADFNGSSQFLSLGGITDGSVFLPVSSSGAKYSVSFWTKLDSLPGTDATTSPVNCGRSGYGKWIVNFRNDSGTKYMEAAFWKSDGNQAYVYNTFNYTTDTAYHCVMVADGSQVRFYINNVEITGGSASYTTLAVEGTNDFMIGKKSHSASAPYFDGKVWNVRIFKNEALDATARTKLYASGAGVAPEYVYTTNRQYPCDHLVDVWGFRETAGNRISRRNSYSADDNGSVGSVDGLGGYKCADFSGSNFLKILQATYDFATLGAAQFSLGTWFRTTDARSGDHNMLECFSTGSPYNGYVLWLDGDAGSGGPGMLSFAFYSGSTAYRLDAVVGGYNDGDWHRIWLVCAGTVLKMYIDAELVGTMASWSYTNPNRPLYIGGTGIGGDAGQFIGQMQELDALDYPVDEKFIEDDYNSGNGRFY